MPATSTPASPSRNPGIATVAALSLAFGLAAASGAASAQAPTASVASEPLIVTIDLNRERQPGTYVIHRTSDGKLWLAVDDLAKLRLRQPAAATRTFDGAEHVPVDALPDARATIDARTLTLAL